MFTKSNQTGNSGSQYQIRTNSVISNPNVSNTETTESVPPSEVTEILTPNSTLLIKVINKPLQVPTYTIRGDPNSRGDPKKP